MKEYNIPTNILENYSKAEDKSLVKEMSGIHKKIEKLFLDNKITSELRGIHTGPAMTLLEYKIDASINLNKVKRLQDNIALALGKSSIRLEVPIRGKDVIGVEFPNLVRNIVPIKDMINCEEYLYSKARLPICLGKSIQGKDVIVDLASFPHLMVSGSTGSGKSICINTIIASLLYRFSHEELNLVMIDPKMVELSMYNGIPHLQGKEVVTETRKAITALREVCDDMDSRYNILKDNGVKSIETYNEIASVPMKYTVVIIDEFADLMLTAKKEIEELISRLVAMARAVGIHVVIATQRPSEIGRAHV